MTHSHTHIYRPMALAAMQNVHLFPNRNAAWIQSTSQCSFVPPFTRAHHNDSHLKWLRLWSRVCHQGMQRGGWVRLCLRSIRRRIFVLSLPATCWGLMGLAFFMKESSLSNARIASVAMLSDFSRAPLVVLSWLLRWTMSSKWAGSPLLDRPFSCLTGWIPLTTWTGRLVEGEECGYFMIIQLQMSHSSPVSVTGAYKCSQKLCSSHLRRERHPQIVVIAYVCGGPISIWAQGNDSRKSFTLHWCCFVHSRSCYLADWPRDLPDNQQTLTETKWNVTNVKPNTLD